MANEIRVTRDDMERAGARVAARDGRTVDEVRALVAKVEDRECERCERTFATANVRKRFCSDGCRAGDHRANGEEPRDA